MLDPHRGRSAAVRTRARRLRGGWGYLGTGCHNLAQLLDILLQDILLQDISAPAAGPGAPEPPRGLFELLCTTPQDGSTTCTRAQLPAARAADA
ncbi:hypothetical protein [Streptomyces sp. NPDC053542]|uniref:hypothetical protein n=1 Tax=Streptomyces sp. NPDC053542 TaxID=3365710 RepID=UPI0037D44CEF